MSIMNNNGEHIGFECSDLIAELEQDIAEFGGDTIVCVWYQECDGVTVYTNYDFIEPDMPITDDEVCPGECLKCMTMTALLEVLKLQNSIL